MAKKATKKKVTKKKVATRVNPTLSAHDAAVLGRSKSIIETKKVQEQLRRSHK
jgi:hypothetical protein